MDKRYAKDYDPCTLVVPLCVYSLIFEKSKVLEKEVADLRSKILEMEWEQEELADIASLQE